MAKELVKQQKWDRPSQETLDRLRPTVKEEGLYTHSWKLTMWPPDPKSENPSLNPKAIR